MDFTLADGKNINLDKGMRSGGSGVSLRTAEVDAGSSGGYRVLELPYKNPNYNMYIGLPKETGLEAINDLAANFDYSHFEAKLRKMKVDVQMPAFEAESTFKLNEPLKAMGMRDMFGSLADFSKVLRITFEFGGLFVWL